MEKNIKKFNDFNDNNFQSRGDIRKYADNLLNKLSTAYLVNLTCDNRSEIQQKLKDIEESGIDWTKDVVISVRQKYKQLTSTETINKHMNRKGDQF